MKILITGAAGFIGYHLTKRLLQDQSIEVVGLDNLNDYYDVKLKVLRLEQLGLDVMSEKSDSWTSKSNDQLSFIKADVSDATQLFQVFRRYKFDKVIHLAAQAGVRYSLINPFAYGESNLLGFLNIIECSKQFEVKHLIYASSSSVYGNSDEIPFREDQPVNRPASLYAATKVANELMAHSYAQLYKLPCTGLRFFTVYGPMGRPDMAYYHFAQNIVNGNPIKVFNNGNLRRDFTYVDDITESIYRLLSHTPKETVPAEIYNIGNNRPVELLHFIELLEKYLGITAKKEFLPMQPGDVFETYADVSRLEEVTGYRPKVPIEDGLKRFADWFIKHNK